MAQQIQMLALSPTMEEGTIVSWHKHEGDHVAAGETLCDVETDKATMEYQSSDEGTLLKVLVPDGETAKVGDPIAILGAQDEDISSLTPSQPQQQVQPAAQKAEQPKPQPAPEKPSQAQPQQLRSTPAARKLAQQYNIDITPISGSGPEGRITEQDIQAIINRSGPKQQAPTQAAPPAPAPAIAIEMKDETVPLSNMRKTIAKRLSESKFTAPDYFLKIDVNADNLMTARQRLNQQQNQKISLNAFLIKLCAEAIKRHPVINASWNNDSIIKHGSIDIGLAVAQENGLITPVIRNCGQKGILQIEQELRPMIERAQHNQLRPEDYSNATFTISNLGSFGIDEFTAIINPPGSAILAVGAAQRRPVAIENDDISVQSIMKLTLTCDHRVIDGAVGAAFLRELKNIIEYPISVLF